MAGDQEADAGNSTGDGAKQGGTPLSQHVLAASLQYRQSRFPPVSEVKGYEKLQPGSWERILAMAEKEQAAQIELHRTIVDFTTADQKRRQWLGSAISIVALVAACILGFFHVDWRIAVALVGVPVLAVAKALVESARGRSGRADK